MSAEDRNRHRGHQPRRRDADAPLVDWPELLGQARYWEVMLAVPLGLGVTLIIGSLGKRWT